MATWREIGLDSFYAAQALYEQGRFRSSVSRSYYAAFGAVTYSLLEVGVRLGGLQETPSHQAVPGLMKRHLPLPEHRKSFCMSVIRRLYAARLAADYQRRATDGLTAREVIRDVTILFRALGVDYD